MLPNEDNNSDRRKERIDWCALSFRFPSVDAPISASDFLGSIARGRMLPSVRLLDAAMIAASLYGSSRTGSKSPEACLEQHGGKPWFFRSRLADCGAILSFDHLRLRHPHERTGIMPPRPELDKFLPWPAATRRSAPSCWPVPPSPACAASSPSSAPATTPLERHACSPASRPRCCR